MADNKATKTDVRRMKREDLDQLAPEYGIKPEDHSNVDNLRQAVLDQMGDDGSDQTNDDNGVVDSKDVEPQSSPRIGSQQDIQTGQTPTEPKDGDVQPAPKRTTPDTGVSRRGGGISRVQTEANDRAQRTAKELEKEPKTYIMIPAGQGESADASHEFQINGHVVIVKKNVMVQVPQSIAEMAAESFNITLHAGDDIKANRSRDVENNLRA